MGAFDGVVEVGAWYTYIRACIFFNWVVGRYMLGDTDMVRNNLLVQKYVERRMSYGFYIYG